MKKIFVFILISILLPLGSLSFAQVDSSRYGGIRLSVNLGKPAGYLLEPKQGGWELALDAEIKDGWFVVAEGGRSEMKLEKYNFNILSSGTFLRLGIDRNFLQRAYNENEIIYGGLRLAGSRFTQEARDVTVPNGYWEDLSTSVPPHQVSAVWIEITAGIRAELFRNVFIGWSIQSRMFLNTGEAAFAPYYVPGYGTTKKNTSLGIQYVIAYRIPYKLK